MPVSKFRIHEIAKELGRTSKEILAKAQELGLAVKTASSAITAEEAGQLADYISNSFEQKPSESAKTHVVLESVQAPQSNFVQAESIELKSEPIVIPDEPIIKKTPKPKESAPATKAAIRKPEEPTPKKEPEKPKKIQKPTQEVETPKPHEEVAKSEAEHIDSAQANESVAQPQAIKRTGLRIVKKGKDDKKKEAPTMSTTALNIQSLLLESAADNGKKQKRRIDKKKPTTTSHKKGEQRLDLLSNRGFSHFGYDEEEEEMILFDLTVRDEHMEEDEQEFERAKPRRENTHRPFHNHAQHRDKKEHKTHRPPPPPPKPKDNTIYISEGIRAYEFADKVGSTLSNVIKILFNLGMMVTKNDFLDKDSIEILAEELNIKVVVQSDDEALEYAQEEQENPENLVTRPPVVTIMGHVDHGKTSLLDRIRNSKITAGEAGGITQHIGAYTIEKDGKMIAFIDTPGHEAFTEMRARGAGVTDIVIIVIAADDGIKPQTIEALDHAKAALAPIIIAINKIDKPEANIDRVKSEAAELGYAPIDWGGEYEFIPISAKTGEGIETLLETVLLQAEILDLKANPQASARAVVIESSLERGKGPVATVILKNGTLHVGDSIVADTSYGRVRALISDTGKTIQSIGPSEVAVVTGFNEVPSAGAILISVANDSQAREYAERRASYLRQKEFSRSTKVSLDELSALVAEGQLKTLPVIIKTDTQGSLEAIKGSLEKIRNDEVKVHVIHGGVGGITESDVLLAQTSQHTVILGFNVRPTGIVKNRAKELGVEIKTYSIIYDLVDEIKSVLSGMMSPVLEEESIGAAEVRSVFKIPKVGSVAGCFVTEGVISRGLKAHIIRDGVVISSGVVSSLKRFKDDVREVAKGFECGIMIDGFNDINEHDVIETYRETQKTKRL
ncbi:MAG: translation initiation factor IF-2 [Helicobacter sp.]|nr:translation initiation factor IF-2 [Helicobacter sp.]